MIEGICLTKLNYMSFLKLSTLVLLTGTVFLSFNTGTSPYQTGMNTGDKIPDLNTTLISGESFSIDNLKGKMVLIDVWASYNAPSRVKNYQLEEIRERFSNSGFYNGNGVEVVSISLDRFMTPVKEAIEMDEIQNFYHICDLQGANGIAKTFQVTEPVTILIDGDGRIVAKSNSMNKISDALSSLVRN